jgi:uncharacterized membrane protein
VTRFQHLWNHLSASYWFIPSIMMASAAALAFGMVWADVHLLGPPTGALWLYTGGPEGARSMLATIAGSVITVAGVGFSIAIVTLTQASRQFGPRLLRTSCATAETRSCWARGSPPSSTACWCSAPSGAATTGRSFPTSP